MSELVGGVSEISQVQAQITEKKKEYQNAIQEYRRCEADMKGWRIKKKIIRDEINQLKAKREEVVKNDS